MGVVRETLRRRRTRLAIVNRMDRRKQEVRERILGSAFDLFLDRGVSATTIEDICERADVANRTFFNHFATRHDMMRALAEERLLNLHDVVFDKATEPIPARLIGLFDDIAATLAGSSDTYREVIAEMRLMPWRAPVVSTTGVSPFLPQLRPA